MSLPYVYLWWACSEISFGLYCCLQNFQVKFLKIYNSLLSLSSLSFKYWNYIENFLIFSHVSLRCQAYLFYLFYIFFNLVISIHVFLNLLISSEQFNLLFAYYVQWLEIHHVALFVRTIMIQGITLHSKVVKSIMLI